MVCLARKEPCSHGIVEPGNLRFRSTFLAAKSRQTSHSNVQSNHYDFQLGDSNDVLMMPPQRGRQLIFSSRAEHSIRIRSFMHVARFIN